MGYAYYEGAGVPQNEVQAYAWFSVSSANGNISAIENRDIVAKSLTQDQLAQGQELAANYYEQYQPKE